MDKRADSTDPKLPSASNEVELPVALADFAPLKEAIIIASAVGVVMAYGTLYWATGGVVTAGGAPRCAAFWESVYFSGITFATVGYGDFVPAQHMRLVALTEGVLGVFTMGFL